MGVIEFVIWLAIICAVCYWAYHHMPISQMYSCKGSVVISYNASENISNNQDCSLISTYLDGNITVKNIEA